MNTSRKIAVVQTDPKLGDIAANQGAIVAGIRDAGADLVVFPECALSGYGFESRAEAARSAVAEDGAEIARMAEACRAARCLAIVGFVERDGERLFNSAALVAGDGVVGVYRKMHLPFIGLDRFADRGDRGFPVFATPVGRIGILICYDLSFPEAARVLKLSGAQVICVPTNWPMAAAVSSEHAPFVRAQENHVAIVTADRVGEEAGFLFRGCSRIVDSAGKELACAGAGRETIRAELDLAASDANRVVYQRGEYELDRIAHRRPEWYRKITE